MGNVSIGLLEITSTRRPFSDALSETQDTVDKIGLLGDVTGDLKVNQLSRREVLQDDRAVL